MEEVHFLERMNQTFGNEKWVQKLGFDNSSEIVDTNKEVTTLMYLNLDLLKSQKTDDLKCIFQFLLS